MSWGAVIVGGASLIGGALSSRGGKKAADAQVKGDEAAIAEQQRQFDLVMQMLAPQRQLGNNALNTLNRLRGFGDLPTSSPSGAIGSTGIGVEPNGGIVRGLIRNVLGDGITAQPNTAANPSTPTFQTQGAPDFSSFYTSPDYEFRRDEGTRGINNSFAARGGALSGNALRRLTEFNSNLAAGEFNNYHQRLLAEAGLGSAGTTNTANAALSTGNNVANLLGHQGDARATGIINQTNAQTGVIGDLAGIYGNWLRSRELGGGTFNRLPNQTNPNTYYG